MPVDTNALYKTTGNLNVYLTPEQADKLAENLLRKAQRIREEGIEDGAVHLWNVGPGRKRIYTDLKGQVGDED